MSARVAVPAVLLLALASRYALAADVVLVTEAEVAREASYAATAPEPVARAAPPPGAPRIEVRSPAKLEGLKAPFPIHLEFTAREGAEVLPSTFRVYDGLLKLDITDRVVQRVRVEKNGIAIEEAAIPAGSHRLFLQIRDSLDRVGETALSFQVRP
jgi:hypothetical protein